MPDSNRILITLKEACAIIKVSRSTFYRRMWDGDITGYKVGRKGTVWHFYEDEVRRMNRPVSLARAS